MDSNEWLASVVGDDSLNAVSLKSGLPNPTLYRQQAKGVLSPEVVVAVARAYGVPVLPGLIACGLITKEEAGAGVAPISKIEALRLVTDKELSQEVLRRMSSGSDDDHPLLTAPLDESHPAVQEMAQEPDFYTLAANRDDDLTDRERWALENDYDEPA